MFDWFRRPKVEAQPQPLSIGEKASLSRIAGRIYRLYLWFEQKGGQDPRKDKQMRESLQRYKYMLGAKGHPIPNTKEEVEHLIDA